MRNLKVMISALEIRSASLILGKTLQAVKLSFEQAMSFRDCFQSFEEMKNFYGAENVLKEGEYYDGYIAVRYSFRTDVIALKGALEKRTKEFLGYMRSEEREAVEKGMMFSCTCDDGDAPYGGKFNYVWTFGDCRFADVIKDMQKRHRLTGSDPEELSESLKKKIIDASIKDETFEVTEAECLLLRTYLGKYFDDFFIES